MTQAWLTVQGAQATPIFPHDEWIFPPRHTLLSQQPWQLLAPHIGPPSKGMPPPAPPPIPPPMPPPVPPSRVPPVMHSPAMQAWPGAQTSQISALAPHAATWVPG
jgi:hypothetical protein